MVALRLHALVLFLQQLMAVEWTACNSRKLWSLNTGKVENIKLVTSSDGICTYLSDVVKSFVFCVHSFTVFLIHSWAICSVGFFVIFNNYFNGQVLAAKSQHLLDQYLPNFADW